MKYAFPYKDFSKKVGYPLFIRELLGIKIDISNRNWCSIWSGVISKSIWYVGAGQPKFNYIGDAMHFLDMRLINNGYILIKEDEVERYEKMKLLL